MSALSQVEAVLFDMGGTLIDYPMPSWPGIVARLVKGVVLGLVWGDQSGLPPAAAVPEPDEAPSRRYTARPDDPLPHRASMAVRRMVRSISGRTLPRLGEMGARPLMANARLVPGAPAVLRALRRRGYRLGLVSNTPWGTPDYLWRGQLQRFGLAECFETTCFSSDVGSRKPDPRIFRTALEALGVAAGRALFVGDEPEADVRGARRAGLRAAWVRRRGEPPDFPAEEAPDLVIQHLADLLDHLPGPPGAGVRGE